ncbi:MAG: hypothetical protein AAF702_46060 [Chloroflexota bacterium]
MTGLLRNSQNSTGMDQYHQNRRQISGQQKVSAQPLYVYWVLLLLLFLLATNQSGCSSSQSHSRESLSARPPSQSQGPALAETPRQQLLIEESPGGNGHPTLVDLWEGTAHFVVQVPVTGLPMGESESVVMANGEIWSYVHASDRSAKVVDRCGAPVPFPGCTVIYRSQDGGNSFLLEPAVCQFECNRCPCTKEEDHINQQQYPRVAHDGSRLHLAYEFGAMIFHRTSLDGEAWSGSTQVPWSGVWDEWLRPCSPHSQTHEHPFVVDFYDCLMGGPPGLAVHDGMLYVFVGLGQNPGGMGCFVGPVHRSADEMIACTNNPLFVGHESYGPLEEKGPSTNAHFGFRTISSAEVQKIGERFYMLFEGVRGPGPGDPGDTQFGLGLARSQPEEINEKWELYSGNPILVDLPGNIGLGHADLIILDGKTVLYTSLDGETRSRLDLAWR